jgi:hypothetical protein
MIPQMDTRDPVRRTRDEQIAAEPHIAPLALPTDAKGAPLESMLRRAVHQPVAVMGIVENGLIRPLDPGVKLTEQSRVIIVAAEAP